MYQVGVRPSYATGFAQWPGMSEYPELWKGCVGLWDFSLGQTGTKVFDWSGNGNTGTFISNPLWVPGTTGPAIDFSDDAINVGSHVFDSCANELTIIAKIRPDGGGSDFGRIIDKFPGPSPYARVFSKFFRFYGEIGGFTRDEEWADYTWVVGTSYVVAFRLGSGFQELYVDGVLADPVLDSGPYAGAYDIGTGVNAYIGNRASDMARDFDGLISYVMIFNRAISASEIALLYQLRKRMA